MIEIAPPQVGCWYRLPGGELFEVVALDERERTIEVQYYDGTVAELEGEGWEELAAQIAEPPEDWSGSLDIDKDDYGVDFAEEPHEQWANPLDYLDVSKE